MNQATSTAQYRLTAYTFAALGAWIFLIQPLFLGAMAEAFQLSPRQIGYLAAVEMAGAALTSALAVFWVNRVDWRYVAAFSLCAASLGNFASIFAPDLYLLFVARFCTSFFGSGIVLVIGLMLLGETRNPDRQYGIANALQVGFSAAALALLPRLLSLGGSVLMLLFLGGIYLCALPLLRWVPAASRKQSASGTPTMKRFSGLNIGVVLTLLSFLFLLAGSGAYWAFIERIGDGAQLSATAIGTYLGIATIIGALGSVTAAILSVRFGRVAPLIIGFIGYAAGLGCINLPVTGLTFVVSAVLFNYSWNLIGPYQFGSLAEFDTTGRFMVMLPAVQAGGVTLGPLLAGQVISGGSFVRASHASFVLMILAMSVLLPVVIRAGSVKERIT